MTGLTAGSTVGLDFIGAGAAVGDGADPGLGDVPFNKTPDFSSAPDFRVTRSLPSTFCSVLLFRPVRKCTSRMPDRCGTGVGAVAYARGHGCDARSSRLFDQVGKLRL